MWEKEKLLFTSNFFFSRRVFKRSIQQTRKNQGLFGKGLTKVRDENMPERKFAWTGYGTHNHQVMSLTWSSLSHPDDGPGFWNLKWCHYMEKKSSGSSYISTFSAFSALIFYISCSPWVCQVLRMQYGLNSLCVRGGRFTSNFFFSHSLFQTR